jgi:hypothetical protein
MPFDWQEYLKLAEHLRDNPAGALNQEAAGRSAVSRAYYAVFCHARNYAQMRENFIPLGDADDHRRLFDHFERTNKRDIARHLQQLRRWRNDADYVDALVGIAAMAKNAVAEAHRVRNKIDAAERRGESGGR